MPLPVYEKSERKDAPLIGLRLSGEMYAKVWAEAECEGIPLAEVVRGVLRSWAATSPKKPSPSRKPATIPSKGMDALTDAFCDELAVSMGVASKDVRKIRQELLDYVESKGAKYTSYPATLRTWVRRKLDEGKVNRLDPHKEKKQEPVGRIGNVTFYSFEEMDNYNAGR